MPSNVVQIPTGPRWRVLIAHQRSMVRHALRTLIEAEDVVVVDVADGEAALGELAFARFDLLVLKLDLPQEDGVTVMLMHRLPLAHQRSHATPPAIIFTLAPEVRGNAALTDHLRTFGIAGLIDDDPRSDAASLIEATLQARVALPSAGKPEAA